MSSRIGVDSQFFCHPDDSFDSKYVGSYLYSEFYCCWVSESCIIIKTVSKAASILLEIEKNSSNLFLVITIVKLSIMPKY
jgi:hypothetical protein